MSSAQNAAGRPALSSGESQPARAGTASNNTRSPSKVAFKEQREEYEYRYQYSDSISSDSEQTTCSTSETSSSPDHGHQSSRRRSGCKDFPSHRKYSSNRHRSRDHKPRRNKQGLQAAAAISGPSNIANIAPPGPPPAAHPQLTMQGQHGMVCAGHSPVHPTMHLSNQQQQQQQQQLPVALVPPPGCGPYPPSSTQPAATSLSPTKAYTSPRSVHDPPPTLLLSSYGGHHPQCPAVAVPAMTPGFAGAQAPPPGPSSLVGPVQMLALTDAAARPPTPTPAPPLPEPGSPIMQYNRVPATAPQQQLYHLPPHPVALPLALPEVPPQMTYAVQHQLNMLYDETMQEVVLADAVMVKELAKQGHGLVPLTDAYRTKLAALQAAVNGPLLAKREALTQQHARLAARAGEVAAQRASLEREVAILAEDMVGRIRGAESLKQSVLAREQGDVGTQLEGIQRLLADVMAASAAGPVDFLNTYSRLMDTCNRLVAKPFKQVVDVAADDLPAEAAVYRDLGAAHEALKQLLGVKDKMISHLLQERDALQDELGQVVERYSAELSALETQCQGYYQRLLAAGVGTSTTAAATTNTATVSGNDWPSSSSSPPPPPPPTMMKTTTRMAADQGHGRGQGTYEARAGARNDSGSGGGGGGGEADPGKRVPHRRKTTYRTGH